jgi:hypothetical protein
MKKQKLKLTIMAVALGLAAQSQAALYDITFSGGSSAGSGEIDVESGVAVSGFFDVFAGVNQGTYDLVGVTSPLINGVGLTLVIPGGNQTFDDVVNAGSNPFLTGDGLEFANSDSVGFNLFGNGPGSYDLFDTGNGQYVIDGGIATLTAAVPESNWTTTSAGLAALGMLGVIARRKKSSVAA